MALDAPPTRPDDAYVARLTELGDWHREWVLSHVDDSPFDPQDRPDGSDYNQHYVDVEADDDEFHDEARRIMGIGDEPGDASEPERPAAPAKKATAARRVTAADQSALRDPTDAEQQAGVDFEQHQQQHDDAAQELHDEWPDIIAAAVAALAAAAGAAVAAGMLAELGNLTVDSTIVAAVGDRLAVVMLALAKRSAKQAVAEVKHQGGTVKVPAAPGEADLTDLAQAVAGIIVNGYTSAAARTAMQSAVPGASGQDVEASVKTALDDISASQNGWVDHNLRGALTAAQAAGRYAVFEQLPADTKYRATERNDRNVCDACHKVDGQEYDSLEAAKTDYPVIGYRACLGGLRCRGMAFPILQ